jgi:hypothetical protein
MPARRYFSVLGHAYALSSDHFLKKNNSLQRLQRSSELFQVKRHCSQTDHGSTIDSQQFKHTLPGAQI